jgi:hypothetical protein
MEEAVIVSGARTAVGRAPKGTLRAIHPEIILLSASGWGRTGPGAGWATPRRRVPASCSPGRRRRKPCAYSRKEGLSMSRHW